jgi:hypothetical protein
MATLTISDLARRYVATIPAAISGSGGHNQTFLVACALVKGFDLSIDEARPLLTEYNLRCNPPWTPAELEHKLRQADKVEDERQRGWLRPDNAECGMRDRAHGGESAPPSRAPSAPLPGARETKPGFQNGKLKAFAARWRQFIDTAWLASRSAICPFTAESGSFNADGFLRAVFREGERVVVFTNQRSQGQAIWPLQEIPTSGDDGVWYLSQPVDGCEHPNPRVKPMPDGKPKLSRRSAESVTSWRHLILESDEADARDWMAALVQLPLRIAAIYTSGKRSIHALVRIDAPTEQEWNNTVRQLKPVLIPLGADPAAMTAVRLTRLPGCLRKGKLQKLLYLDPGADLFAGPAPEPICARPVIRDVLRIPVATAECAMRWKPSQVKDDPEFIAALAALEWYASAPAASAMLARIKEWKAGDIASRCIDASQSAGGQSQE